MTPPARTDAAKDIEILVLRHQLDRAFAAAPVRRLPRHRRIGLFATLPMIRR